MAEADQAGKYRIGTVARITGLSPHTLRVWERRYDSLRPSRSAGGGRLYSEADLARLKLIKQLQDRGHAIGTLVGLSREELERILATHHGQVVAAPPGAGGDASLAGIRSRFLEAIERLDVATAEAVLSRATASLEPRVLALEVVWPILQEVGDRWEQGALRVAHEHAASALLRNQVAVLLRQRSGTAPGRRAVVSTLSGELHEFGALLATLVLLAAGWEALYLGPNLPAAEVAAAATQSGARAVLISCVVEGDGGAAEQLRVLRAALPGTTEVWVGGRAAAACAGGVTGVRRMETLADLEKLVVGAVP